MLPLSDGMRARRFPVVTVALIAANLGVWILYELPDLDAAVREAAFHACDVDNTCYSAQPWTVSNPEDGGSGAAFAAHVGDFLFGMLAAHVLAGAGRIRTQETPRSALSPF